MDRHLYGKFYAVVEHEEGFVFLAERDDFKSRLPEFFIGGILKAELYPFAASFEDHLYFFRNSVALGWVGYELEHKNL